MPNPPDPTPFRLHLSQQCPRTTPSMFRFHRTLCGSNPTLCGSNPRATTAMVLGIVAVAGGMLCYLPALCGPVALVIGLKSLNAIKAQPHLGGRSEAMTGFILGIIATLLLVLSTLFVAFIIWFAVEYPEEFRTLVEDY